MTRVAQLSESSLDRIQKEIRQEQDKCRTRNQVFVTPALGHMPISVVSVRVREH